MSEFRDQKIFALTMLESGEIRLKSAQKNLRRKLQLFSTTGSVALWSETKLKTIMLQFCS
jgi:predicted ATP-dependent endonuclease of OLD family